MAVQSANGFQTGLSVFPSQVAMNSATLRSLLFNASGGILGDVGVAWSLSTGAKGTISSAGVYTPPASISSPSVDQVLATAIDGSQAQALVSLSP